MVSSSPRHPNGVPAALDLPTSLLAAAGRPLRLGDKDDLVPALRALLIRSGALMPGPAPQDETLFDPALDAGVRAFQQDRGLVADGVVGPQTALALDGARWGLGDRTLLLTAGHWMRGDDVAALQERMVVLGMHAGPVDGIYGPATEASLRELQRGLGLPPDGICSRTTFTALGALGRSVSGGDAWALRSRGSVAMAGVSLSGKTVVLDPGSDRTPGVDGITEAAVAYDVALRLADRLTTVGAKVQLTRKPDEDISAEDRVALAESVNADLVISMDAERHTNPVASGVATFYWGGGRVGQHSEVGHRLAHLMQREITVRTSLPDCRSHPCSYDLVRLTRMPAVILALGYLTSPTDAEQLGRAEVRAQVAEAVLFAVQRLYLAENDAETGTLQLSDVQAFARQR